MNKKSLKFHIENNDYFGTLATVLNLVLQNLEEEKFKKKNINVLKDGVNNLMYLQNKYKIIKTKNLRTE